MLIKDFLHLGNKNRNVNSWTIVNCNDFKTVYSLFSFDVSKYRPNIYASGSTADIKLNFC